MIHLSGIRNYNLYIYLNQYLISKQIQYIY